MSTTGRRRRSERQHPNVVLIRATVVILLVSGLIYVAITAVQGLPLESHYKVTARFQDAKNVVKNSEVWIAGRRVGTVLGGDGSGHTSSLDLSLDASVKPLPADTTARIRYTSLLGALVVELTPGRSERNLPDGGTIPATQTSSATQTADVLSALDQRRRPELGTTLRGLGEGFLGQGATLNRTLGEAPTFLDDARRTSDGVLARTGAAERFFPALNRLSSAADPVRDDIAQGFDPEARALDSLDPSSVRALLRVAPSALSGVQAGLHETDPLLTAAAAFSRSATTTLMPAAPALRQGTLLLREARQPISRLRPLLTKARASVTPVLGLTDRARVIAGRTSQGLQAPQPVMKQFARHECDFLTWGRNWRSMLSFGPKGSPVSSDVGPLTGLRVQLQQLGTDQSVLGREPVNNRGINGYPEPCRVGRDRTP